MPSISSASNAHHRIEQHSLPAQEGKADSATIPKPDLAWWRRLLNFFKSLFDKIFNRNQDAQPNVAKAKLLSDDNLNKKLAHQILRLSETQNDQGVKHHIKQLNGILAEQMTAFLKIVATDPQVSLKQDMKEQIDNLHNGRVVLCSVMRAKRWPKTEVSPISLDETLFDTITKSHNSQLKDMAKDMLTTLQITKQALSLLVINITHNPEHQAPPVLFPDEKEKLQSLLKGHDISKHISEILSITADSLLTSIREKAARRQQSICDEVLPKARDIFKAKLKSRTPHTDLPASHDEMRNNMTDIESFAEQIHAATAIPRKYEYLLTPFVNLLSLNIGPSIDQPNQDGLDRKLNDLSSAASKYISWEDAKLNVPKEYEDFTHSLLSFMQTMLPEQTGIPKETVERWISDNNISARAKWRLPQELTQRFEQNIVSLKDRNV